MQTAMQDLAQVQIPSGKAIPLAMKVTLVSGPARRFVVGDPGIQLLDVLAGVATNAGDPQRATRLAGAVDALLVSIQAKMEAEVCPVYEHAVATARTALGEDGFRVAWAEGERMRLDDIVSYALGEP
jgi:hypothetical protein